MLPDDPLGYAAFIVGRSGLALEKSLVVGGGLIDPDYRGEVKVIFNYAGSMGMSIQVKKGDRIAQFILIRCFTPPIVEVAELAPSSRGVSGFGSTGR